MGSTAFSNPSQLKDRQEPPTMMGIWSSLKAAEPSVGSASKEDPTANPSPLLFSHYAPPITPEYFLEAAKRGADLSYLHGRDTTAEKLGISNAEAKRLVGRQIYDGQVVVGGERLRLAETKDTRVAAQTIS
jgi:hypothetical protein